MKTLLVLVDHSYSAFNAARYALSFAGSFDNCKVILYNSFNYLADSASELAYVSAGLESLKEQSIEQMADLEISLEPFRKPGTLIETIVDDRQLALAVSEISRDRKVDLTIAGSKNRSPAGMLLIGSRITDLFKDFESPILVIPSTYIYEPVMCAVLATDLENVEKLPQSLINKFITDYRCRLLVLNVNPREEEHRAAEQIQSIGKLHRLLEPNRPDYHYTSHHDVSEEIRIFSEEQHAGLIIIIHKEHSFLHKLFNRSVEKEMAMHSHVPVLILSELE
ncbi:MAG: universal stress protein [Bacteroidota bacterium]